MAKNIDMQVTIEPLESALKFLVMVHRLQGFRRHQDLENDNNVIRGVGRWIGDYLIRTTDDPELCNHYKRLVDRWVNMKTRPMDEWPEDPPDWYVFPRL